YPGWGPEWNEWVLSDRIVDNLAAKQRVEVNWKGHWYPAVILKEKDGKYHIHYLDYDESWDEWVCKNRIRFKKPKDRWPRPDPTGGEQASPLVALLAPTRENVWPGYRSG